MDKELIRRIKGVTGFQIEQDEANPDRYKFMEQGGITLGYVEIIDNEPNLVDLHGPLNRSELEGFFVAFREIENEG